MIKNNIFLVILAVMVFIGINTVSIADDIVISTVAPGGGGLWSKEGSTDNIYYDKGAVSVYGYTGATGDSGILRLCQARGIQSAPTATQSGDRIGFIGFKGYDGTAFTTDRACIQAYTVAPWTTTDQGAAMAFSTTPDGSTTMATRMVISPRGNVGINETSPHEKLDVGGGVKIGMAPATNTTLSYALANGIQIAIVASTAGYPSSGTILIGNELMFYTGTTATTFTGLARARLGTTAAAHSIGDTVYANFLAASSAENTTPVLSANSSGNVGINTSAPNYTLHIAPLSSDGAPILNIDGFGSGVDSGRLMFNRSSGTKTAPLAVEANDYLGAISFRGYTGTGYSPSRASIGAWAPQAWTATDQGTNIVVYTTIPQTVTPVVSLNLQWYNTGGGAGDLYFEVGKNLGAGNTGRVLADAFMIRPRSSDPVQTGGVGWLYYNSTTDTARLRNSTGWRNITTTAVSSLRYKNNIVPLADDFNKILQAEPKSFTYKNTGKKDIGYIAEDFDNAGLKNLVEYDEQGRPDSIKYEKISIYALEVIKEQQKQIAELTKKVEALEKNASKNK